MTATAPAVATVPTRRTSRHLYEIDVLRLLTFLCVIGVHTIGATADKTDLPMWFGLDLLHFTREVFFALTAFVLVYSYQAHPVPMRRFWSRRFLLIGLPYLTWSAIYIVVGYLNSPSGGLTDVLHTYLLAVAQGTAKYHLYFLLVTMQVYLLVPVIIWLVRVTRGRHPALLLITFAVQAGLLAWLHYDFASTGWYGRWAKTLFVTYTFVIVAGAVAADHQQAFLTWIRERRGVIAALTGGCLAVLGVAFWAEVHVLGSDYNTAGSPMQPVMVLWGAAIALAFLAVGSWWADRRRAGSLMARFVDRASDRSFAIFLVHPLILWWLLLAGDGWLRQTVPTPWLTLVTYALVLVGSVLVAEIARITPLSLALTGRRRARRSG